LDLATQDAERMDNTQISHAISDALQRLKQIATDEEACLNILYE
jgi:hypothetical protein